MDAELYREMMIRQLKSDETFEPVQIPVDLLPGEDEEMAAQRWLYDRGILFDKDGMTFINQGKAEAFDPNLFRALKVIFEPEMLETLDALEEKGMIVSGIGEDGQMYYSVTDAGKEYLENS